MNQLDQDALSQDREVLVKQKKRQDRFEDMDSDYVPTESDIGSTPVRRRSQRLAADGSQATKKRAKSGKQRPKTTKKSNRTPGNTRRKPQHQQEIEVNQATGSQPSWTMISSARLICSCGIKVSKAVELHDTNRSYWMILSHCPGCGSKTPIDNLSL